MVSKHGDYSPIIKKKKKMGVIDERRCSAEKTFDHKGQTHGINSVSRQAITAGADGLLITVSFLLLSDV